MSGRPRGADVDLDVMRLSAWLDERLPGRGGPSEGQRIGQDVGIANALFALRRTGQTVVMRRPATRPAGGRRRLGQRDGG